MNLKVALLITVCLATIIWLGGCATCERHPVACTAAVGIVATSIALSRDQGRPADPRRGINPPNCAANPTSCQ